jgi:hypothetical protein
VFLRDDLFAAAYDELGKQYRVAPVERETQTFCVRTMRVYPRRLKGVV